MARYDPKTGKLHPTWTIRFSPWITMLGSLIGGLVCGLVLIFTLVAGSGMGKLADAADVARGSILLLGGCLVVFAILGPTLAWGLGFALRENTNHGVHVLAFGALGLFVGYSVGTFMASYVGIAGFGSIAAPAAGLGAAVGRWSISRWAKI